MTSYGHSDSCQKQNHFKKYEEYIRVLKKTMEENFTIFIKLSTLRTCDDRGNCRLIKRTIQVQGRKLVPGVLLTPGTNIIFQIR